jgi:hypothetical protein
MRVGGHAELFASHRSNTLPDKKVLHKSAAPGETKEVVRRSLSSRIVLAAITLAVLLARSGFTSTESPMRKRHHDNERTSYW